jgi:hypothetical protein
MDLSVNSPLRQINEEYIRSELDDIFNESLKFYSSTNELVQRCKKLLELQSNKDDLNISVSLLAYLLDLILIRKCFIFKENYFKNIQKLFE